MVNESDHLGPGDRAGGQPKKTRRRQAAGAGAGGVAGTLAMACPVCNPLAIPLFGAAGVLSFLAPERGLIALLSIALLAVTLVLRLRTTQACQLTSTREPDPSPATDPPRKERPVEEPLPERCNWKAGSGQGRLAKTQP